ncbi:MAG: CHAT domain-containing protein, partial [Acidobacteria bacterium]|nr:CHAT domain-containing protein [Acidobacteriota bacterium]
MFKQISDRFERSYSLLRNLRLFHLSLLLLCIFAHSPNAQASGVHSSLPQSPSQQQNAEAQSEQDAATLELSKPVKREIGGGQRHNYGIALTAGQHIRVEIEPQGIDLGVSLQLPDGNIRPIYQPIGLKQEQLVIERVAEISGIYQFTIYTRAKAVTGRYEIRLAELRVATENDLALQQARNLFGEYRRLTHEGKFTEARPLVLRALEIREKVSGPDDLKVAEMLENLSASYVQTGDYASAEPLELRVLKIKEKAFGPEHPQMADALRNLGVFYYDKGDYLKAEELIQKALGIFEKSRQPENLIIASALSYLGNIYYARNDYGKAESYYRRSLAIREKNLGADHFHLTESLGSIGRVAYDAGDYAKAEAMYGRALALSEKAFGPDHTQLAWSLNNLAMIYATTGDYAKAEAFYRRALTIHEQKTGMYARNVQATLLGLARLYTAQGLASEAIKFQTQASELEERYVGLNLAVGSEREKLALLDDLSLLSSRRISLHTNLAPHDPAARELAVTTILGRKGRVQDSMSDSIAALRRRFSAEDQKLLDELNALTAKLAKLVLNVPQNATPAEHQEQVKTLETSREKLEAEINRRSAGFYAPSQPVTLTAVQRAIPEGAALIEFATYRPFDPKAPDNLKAYGEARYVAYVMRGQEEVGWTKLGEAKEIDANIVALRQALRDPKRRDVRQLARALDEKVMQPVRALLGSTTQLLISPDGGLNLIPFEALVDEQGRHLIQSYSFTYLTSGRDLLRMQAKRAATSDPVLAAEPVVIANPSFGEPVLTEQVARVNAARKPVARTSRRMRRSVTGARSLSEVYFAPLTGTAQEAHAIQTLYPEADLFTGAEATESALRRINAPRILHVATHGFFLEDAGTSADARVQATARGAGAIAKNENPLLRSGLALAGANQRGSAAGDDGILTALEASGLNLWGTKLAVLSACDTGVGEVRNGEGVYGLRRAFVLAGAESLVMSLWPVSDYSTRVLMT